MLPGKMATTSLLIVASLVLACHRGMTAPTDCSSVLCPAPSCANPAPPLNGECCSSCQASRCPLKGCVNRQQGKVVWQPDPCTTCQCLDNRPLCAAVSCALPSPGDCLGFPMRTSPWECCPSCAFDFPPNSCNVVPRPFGGRNMSVSDGGRTCGRRVALSTCDKSGYRANGLKFQCVPTTGRRLVEFGEDCPLNMATYMDVVKCNAVRNDDVIVGCDSVVP